MASKLVLQGHFTGIGMRTRVDDTDALVLNSCSNNDEAVAGDDTRWSWCNPTNRAIVHRYHDVEAVSLESLWQSTKLMQGQTRPDPEILAGNWRKNKGKKPVGAYAGPGNPLITTPGAARRAIYIPAFRNLIDHWLQFDEIRVRLKMAREWKGNVFLRDHDTGRGIDRNGPMSHAYVLAEFLNNKGVWLDGISSSDLVLELLK